jgi:hypothetical protein
MKRLFTIMLMAFTVNAFAGYTGNDLLRDSTSNEAFARGVSYGYVTAVGHAFDGETFCIPPNVTNQQTMDIVKQYLIAAPDKRHNNCSFIVSFIGSRN